ncbi:hypothetical protein K443DRAFT_524391 [Laccaria amethystina LaAM-08-1]|uniref:Unplaced genomic scaffold K443scaffold_59, whole genome shotgun sequence n=1 Tax=Laccaria amethystina LaAM-08-1 TaxID=1095629 RepID=A0A0C9WTH6_9AGAR|nr:hypothetical protein K443DRAFT_524391 [Laccaria amethystina LaAM-08-1]
MATSDQHIHKSVTPYKQSPWLCRLHLHVSDSIDLLHTNREPDPPGLFRRLSDKTTLSQQPTGLDGGKSHIHDDLLFQQSWLPKILRMHLPQFWKA